MSAPFATEELLKMFEERANDAAASARASRRAAKEVTDRYAEIVDRVKAANVALTSEMSTIQQQLMAEVSAAMNSPLVERCKRAYRVMLAAYSQEVVTATSGAVESRSELESATRRAADAYARATADLTAELVRQLPAAYERYLTSVVNASMDADLTGLVAAANEELLDSMARAYQPDETTKTDEHGNGDGSHASDEAGEGMSEWGTGLPDWGAGSAGAGVVGGDDWGAGTTEADEALWASARADTWGVEPDEGWATAATPTLDTTGTVVGGDANELVDSPWGPVGSGFADVGLPDDDVGLAPWGSTGVYGSDDADRAGGEVTDEPSDAPAAEKSVAKKSAAKKSAVKKSAAKKSAVKKSTAKKSTAKKSTAGNSPSGADSAGD